MFEFIKRLFVSMNLKMYQDKWRYGELVMKNIQFDMNAHLYVKSV